MNYNTWQEYKLSDVCEIKYGKDHKKLPDGFIPTYGTGGIMRYVDSYLYNKPSVLIPRKGTLSNLFYVDKKFWTVDTLFWTKINDSIVLPKFLYYLLLTYKFDDMNVGSAVPSLTTASLNEVKVTFPQLKEQKAIANILSSLDDKIELNNKINDRLEELAQTLYKRWFVDFEFPNEEGEPYTSSGGEMVDSELGLIPKGWIVSKLGDSSISSIIGSGISKFIGEKKYIATADVSNTSIDSFEKDITYLERPSRANMQPIENSVWFAKMKDSRKLVRVSSNSKYLLDRCIFSTGFAGIKCSNSLNYLWSYILSQGFDTTKNNLSNGTTMQAINKSNINKIPIIVPKQQILIKFEDSVSEYFNLIENNKKINNKLIKLRDTLLPKLMSGEIQVPVKE